MPRSCDRRWRRSPDFHPCRSRASPCSRRPGGGASLRPRLGGMSRNLFVQPFCAALRAGVVGAIAVRLQLSSVLRLVAVCPCMVLVPGPHLLNGALDLARARIILGTARISYASL